MEEGGREDGLSGWGVMVMPQLNIMSPYTTSDGNSGELFVETFRINNFPKLREFQQHILRCLRCWSMDYVRGRRDDNYKQKDTFSTTYWRKNVLKY